MVPPGRRRGENRSRDGSAVSIGTTKDDVCDRTIIIKWEWVEEENCIVLI